MYAVVRRHTLSFNSGVPVLEINFPTCAKSLLNFEVLSPSVPVGAVESN
jgi:hypothetical protein